MSSFTSLKREKESSAKIFSTSYDTLTADDTIQTNIWKISLNKIIIIQLKKQNNNIVIKAVIAHCDIV